VKTSSTGSLVILVAAFLYSTSGVFAKLLGNSFEPLFQAGTRALIGLVILGVIGYFTNQFKPIPKADWKWYAIICAGAAVAFPTTFYAYNQIGITTHTLIFFSVMGLTTLFIGIVLLKEQLTKLKISCFILAILGLTLITLNNLQWNSLLGLIASVICGLGSGISFALVQKLSKVNTGTQITAMSFAAITFASLSLAFIFQERFTPFSNLNAWGLQFVYSLMSLLGSYLLVLGFKRVEPSIGGLVSQVEIVFAVLLGIVLFHEKFEWLAIVGCAFIVTAAVLPDGVRLIGRHRNKAS